jgi:hypothetical protein
MNDMETSVNPPKNQEAEQIMKIGDVMRFGSNFEFEAIDEDDNPIGMRLIPAGTTCIIEAEPKDGWVSISIANKDWKEEWGVNDILDILVEEADLKGIPHE